ncbi:MAG: 2-C-methyl-D-erythritol 4-phosphate cytidylyltransferase [Planctomycetes bacterium]|nr:2-C-methyl-D-erythritol 4-phosphate cytidylyltransferase [Planctomycetota bacterium]
MPDFSLIIVAGGAGTRMGASTPKAFLDLAGEPIVLRSVRAFAGIPGIAEVIVVVPREEMSRLTGLDGANVAATEVKGDGSRAPLARRLVKSGVTRFVSGGKRRQDSVVNGLKAASEACEYVMIHDAARPFVRREDIEGLMSRTREVGAAILALPVKDTIKRVDQNGNISATVDRAMLWSAQTPQGFRRVRLLKAYEKFGKQDVTDDAALLERTNEPCTVVQGDAGNFKITTPDDLALGERLIAEVNKGTGKKKLAHQHSAVFYQIPEQQTVIELEPPEIMDVSKANSPEQLYDFALTAFNARDYKRALKHAKAAANNRQDWAAAHALVAACYDQLGRSADALNAAHNAVDADPGGAQWQHNLGAILLGLKRYSDADKAFAKALALDDKLPATHFSRAVALSELGQADAAKKHLKTATELNPQLRGDINAITALRKLS